jgi:uncharacterized protein (TIGR02265 family)
VSDLRAAREAAIEEVSQFCDLRERLLLVPPSAVIRGQYFRAIEAALTATGKAARYRALFPERHAALRWYPMHDFLQQLAVGAALLRSPERVHDGMFQLGRGNAKTFSESVLGRLMLRLLSREPERVLRQALAGRRQSSKPARWELSFPEERTAVMALIEEYGYIESYMFGAAHGTFEMVGVPVRIECVLEDRFTGKHIFRW